MTDQPIFYKPKICGLVSYNPYKGAQSILNHAREVLLTYASLLPLTRRQVYYRLVATNEAYPKSNAF